MIRQVKTFTRHDGTICTVDTTSGERVVSYARPGQSAPTKERVVGKRRDDRRASAAKAPAPAGAPKPNRTDCLNIVGYTGETTAHQCGGCPGGQATGVWECSKFGDCAPLAWAPVPDKEVRRCVDCGAYTPSA